jgi:DNA-binding CsgD family transcriptional regulator
MDEDFCPDLGTRRYPALATSRKGEADAVREPDPGQVPAGTDEFRGVRRAATAADMSIARFAAEAVLEKLLRGVIIIDREAHVVFANQAARKMLERCDAFRLTLDSRVVLTERGMQRRFASHMARVIPTSSGSMTFRVDRGGNTSPYRILVTLLSDDRLRSLVNGSGPLHAIFIYEPHARCHLPMRILRELYGLTAAESELAMLLFEGLSVRDSAGRLTISVNTVRTHLKHIFGTCNVDSQAELMRLLALGPRTI